MTKDEFIKLLELSSDKARDFALTMVTNHLPKLYKYFLNIAPAETQLEDFQKTYPEEGMDDFEMYGPVDSGEIVNKLLKDLAVPEWIDIQVYNSDQNYTYFDLLCCNRFTNREDRFYYRDRGTGPFGIKSPTLPVRSIENPVRADKFDLNTNVERYTKIRKERLTTN